MTLSNLPIYPVCWKGNSKGANSTKGNFWRAYFWFGLFFFGKAWSYRVISKTGKKGLQIFCQSGMAQGSIGRAYHGAIAQCTDGSSMNFIACSDWGHWDLIYPQWLGLGTLGFWPQCGSGLQVIFPRTLRERKGVKCSVYNCRRGVITLSLILACISRILQDKHIYKKLILDFTKWL